MFSIEERALSACTIVGLAFKSASAPLIGLQQLWFMSIQGSDFTIFNLFGTIDIYSWVTFFPRQLKVSPAVLVSSFFDRLEMMF